MLMFIFNNCSPDKETIKNANSQASIAFTPCQTDVETSKISVQR